MNFIKILFQSTIKQYGGWALIPIFALVFGTVLFYPKTAHYYISVFNESFEEKVKTLESLNELEKKIQETQNPHLKEMAEHLQKEFREHLEGKHSLRLRPYISQIWNKVTVIVLIPVIPLIILLLLIWKNRSTEAGIRIGNILSLSMGFVAVTYVFIQEVGIRINLVLSEQQGIKTLETTIYRIEDILSKASTGILVLLLMCYIISAILYKRWIGK